MMRTTPPLAAAVGKPARTGSGSGRRSGAGGRRRPPAAALILLLVGCAAAGFARPVAASPAAGFAPAVTDDVSWPLPLRLSDGAGPTVTPVSASGPVIVVASTDALLTAYRHLSETPGGGTILLDGGAGPYALFLYGAHTRTAGTEPVVIRSADPARKAQLSDIHIRDMRNIRIENVRVAGEAKHSLHNVLVQESRDIAIVGSHFSGPAMAHAATPSDQAGNGILVRNAGGILFADNLVEGYNHGLGLSGVDGAVISGNAFRALQGDGIRGAGLRNARILGNRLHDFLGSDQLVNHSDLIQIFGRNAETLTENILIAGNVLMASGLGGSQSIFIRNEEFGAADDPTAGRYRNITVADNLIYNAHTWGIYVADTDGVRIENNTALWNTEARIVSEGEARSLPPEILVLNSRGAILRGNIAAKVRLAESEGVLSGSFNPDYTHPASPDYVGRHIPGVRLGSAARVQDLGISATSPHVGKGAAISQPRAP
jgi:parallel beta-helix repeat protein